MSLCPAISVGVAGGQPDVNAINAAFALIRSILNGDIDAANVENGSITAIKFNAGLRTIVPVPLFGAPPAVDTGTVSAGYVAGTVDGFAMDLASFRAPVDCTIVGVSYRRLSSLPSGNLMAAELWVNGVAQGATNGNPLPMINAAPIYIGGLNIAVLTGQYVGLRVDWIAPLLPLVTLLPIECFVYLDVPLS